MLTEILEALDRTTVLLAGVAFILIYILLDTFRTKPRLPPQPGLALPLIGHLYKLDQDPRAQFKQWRKQYGDVFSLYLGTKLAVVLNGYSAVKEAFHTRGDQFSHRGVQYFDLATGITSRGILTSTGPDWREQRSSVLTILRRLGVGKNPMAEKIEEEVLRLSQRLEAFEGKPQNVSNIFNISVSNVLCSILVGRRFEYDDKDFQTLMRHIAGFVKYVDSTNPLNFYPALRHIPGDPFHGREAEMHIRGIIEVFAERYCKDIGANDNENEVDGPENIIAAYIQQMNKKKKSGVSTFMDKDSLLRVVFDLFTAGTETTSTTIDWALLFAILYPEVQEKIFAEIKREVGTERLPNVHDRNQLVYLNAFIMETQRMGNVVPFALPHANFQDTKLYGFDIPKGSYVIGNIDSVFSDSEVWGEDVQTFRPERFLDSSGHLFNREELIPFSIGKRVCVGESLAAMELFLFLAILFQKFRFAPADEDNLPSAKPVFGITLHPQPFDLRAVSRR